MAFFYIGTCRNACFALEKRLKLFSPRIKAYMHEARKGNKVLTGLPESCAQKEREVLSKNKQTSNLSLNIC